jgi:uncharacterized protein YbjT (DUF2867 family)
MNVILFGATGMVGQGVLRECLLDPEVQSVLSLGRSSTGRHHPKLREIVRKDLFDPGGIEKDLTGLDACFFCLGVTSAGLTEQQYARITHDLAVLWAQALVKANPGMTFVFVSGAGSDTKGRAMWQRVKGRAEDALLALPFKATYVFRPAFIQPLHGIRSRTISYRVLYAIFRPLFLPFRALFPKFATTTEQLGRAMIGAAKRGAPRHILESGDIPALAG